MSCNLKDSSSSSNQLGSGPPRNTGGNSSSLAHMQISVAGWGFLALITVWMPLAAIRSAKRLKKPEGRPSRKALLLSVVISQVLFAGLALLTAWKEFVELFPLPNWQWLDLGLAAAFLIPALATVPWRWRTRSIEQRKKMLWRLPQLASDLWGWALISLSAGIGEEIVYRGVLLQLWERVLGSWGFAAALCSAVFALAHFHQGLRSMMIILAMAIAQHWIVRLTGNLYTTMIIHTTYDFVVGIMFLSLARREGLLPLFEEAPSPGASGAEPSQD